MRSPDTTARIYPDNAIEHSAAPSNQGSTRTTPTTLNAAGWSDADVPVVEGVGEDMTSPQRRGDCYKAKDKKADVIAVENSPAQPQTGSRSRQIEVVRFPTSSVRRCVYTRLATFEHSVGGCPDIVFAQRM